MPTLGIKRRYKSSLYHVRKIPKDKYVTKAEPYWRTYHQKPNKNRYRVVSNKHHPHQMGLLVEVKVGVVKRSLKSIPKLLFIRRYTRIISPLSRRNFNEGKHSVCNRSG